MVVNTESSPPQPESAPVGIQPAFLEKVTIWAGLPDIYDARDISVVVFRTLRDLMTADAAKQVETELKGKPMSSTYDNLRGEIAALWRDTNPLVALLSRIRPPLVISDELFVRRVRQEAGLPRGVEPELAIKAIFAATKAEISAQSGQAIALALPDAMKSLWNQV